MFVFNKFKSGIPVSIVYVLIILVLLLNIFYFINPLKVKAESSIKEKENKESANTGLNISVLVMLIIMLLILFLFIMEPVRIDLIALLIPVILVVLNKWTFIDKSEALSGFSNSATITALAMFILSEGIQNSGLVQLIENKIASITGDSEVREVGFVSGISGIVSGFLYNTPVVAIFIPMVTDLARNTDISPSKLLIPLSYAATMGGLLTIVGSGVNLLASEISASLINRPFSFFEFTHLGILILITGVIYFISVGRHLLPDHVQPEEDLVDEYEMKPFIAEVVVEVDSSLIGQSINETLEQSDLDMDLIMLTRDGKEFVEPLQPKTLQAGDKLIIRSDRETLLQLMRQKGLSFLLEPRVSEEELESPSEGNLIETVITSDSIFAGKTLTELNFMERYDCSVLAIRRGSELSHYKLDEIELQPGDVLLMLTNESTLERFRKRRDIIVAREMEQTDYSQEKIPYVVGIMIGVILLGVSEIIPLSIASLMGVIAMVMTGCVKPPEMYEAVNWQIIILMAGLIPLGSAMETTGTANFLAGQILKITGALPPLIILALFYLFTSVVTNIVSNRASIVMMVPVAVDAALRLGVEPFSFIVAVTVAASTAYLTPIGNQVHLLVYGPGGYKFGDYFKVGFPLQLLLTVVVTVGIVFFWGI